jgi:hypothetical protein
MLPCVPTRAGPHQHFLHEWETFAQLSTDRPVGVTHGAIPWTSIGRHTARHGIAGDDFNRLCRLICAMDAAYLAYFKDKLPSASLDTIRKRSPRALLQPKKGLRLAAMRLSKSVERELFDQ